jgi:NADH dehydrogenase FAD-containing subunit
MGQKKISCLLFFPRSSSLKFCTTAFVMTLPIVIVGGGVAGVCCAQELLRLQRQPGASLFRDIILISSVPVVSTPINVVERSSLADFQLRSVPMSEFAACGVICIHGTVISIESNQHSLTIQRNESANIEHIAFHKLCICTGARPLTFQADESVLPRIITSM